jgi:hypothetical protein
MATVVGGSLALGVHWAASRSGKELQPYVLTGSMFVMSTCQFLYTRSTLF